MALIRMIMTVKISRLRLQSAVSFLGIFNIGDAGRESINKYNVLVDDVVSNIESLSKGVGSSLAELRSLSYE